MIIDKYIFMRMLRFYTSVFFLLSGLYLNAQDCSKYHQVLKGETLYGIARVNECTVDQLVSANPNLILPLQEGASICIPSKNQNALNAQESNSVSYHTVALGESIYGLSKKYKCSIDTLYSLNPSLLETGLNEGQKIRVPTLKLQEIQNSMPNSNRRGAPTKPIQIALFGPFDDSRPEYFEVALSFMEGVQLAISDWSDSLPSGVSLMVYDEFEPFAGFNANKPSVVFGPFLSQNYGRISPKITSQNIPIFSPFSKQWEPKSQSEFKVNHSEVEAWVTYIAGYYKERPNSAIFLSKASMGKDSVLRSQVAAELKKQGVAFSTCEATGSGIASQSSVGQESLVALFVSNELRVRNILTGLTRSSSNPKNVQLLVPDDWLHFQVMEVGYYQKYNVHILASSHYLEFPLEGSSWAERFKLNFNAWPDSYAETGYLLTSFVLRKSMFLDGRNWVETIKTTELDGLNLRFDFSKQINSGSVGLNRRVRIIGFENGQAVYKMETN